MIIIREYKEISQTLRDYLTIRDYERVSKSLRDYTIENIRDYNRLQGHYK